MVPIGTFSVGSRQVLSFGAKIIEKFQVLREIWPKRHFFANQLYFSVVAQARVA